MESSSTDSLLEEARSDTEVCGEVLPEWQQLTGPHYQPVHEVLQPRHLASSLPPGRYTFSPDRDGHRTQGLIHTKPVLVLLPVKEVPEVCGADVGAFDDMCRGGASIGTDPLSPVSRGVLQQTEAPSLSGRVAGLPVPFTAIVRHPPVFASVPRQGDLLLLLPANLVTEEWAAGNKRSE